MWIRQSLLLASLVIAAGCTRTEYRLRADTDAYGVLHEKTDCWPWRPASDFSIYPAPESRLHDPTPTDDPCLPVPAPQLYNYALPQLPTHEPSRFRQSEDESGGSMAADGTPAARRAGASQVAVAEAEVDGIRQTGSPQVTLRLTPPEPAPLNPPTDDPAQAMSRGKRNPFATVSLRLQPAQPVVQAEVEDAVNEQTPPANTVDEIEPSVAKGSLASEDPAADGETLDDFDEAFNDEAMEDSLTRRRVPIPQTYWNSIPEACLRRMLEFESVAKEFEASKGEELDEGMLDDAPRLALEDIVQLTRLNSRELQSQKEQLYLVALRLTLERFAYQLKPSFRGNNTAANFVHNRNAGVTVNSLGIPTNLALDRTLWTGGDLLARFANTVVLTFNGPQGFVADVGSELFFEITQSIFQRDILLESLTQAERDVVYAARSFARFRKQLFVTLASQYYRLIRQYRQIEIDSQNYFTLVREFNQREAEFRAGLASRIQLDQIEQQVINGRRGLLTSCTNLENAMDDLKIRIGLPTEQRINLDLTELRLLTLRDELAVNTELVARVERRLASERDSEAPARATLLSSATVLVDRVLESVRLREELGIQKGDDAVDLLPLRTSLQVEAARMNVSEAEAELNSELSAQAPSQAVVFQRRLDTASELIRLVALQLEYAEETNQMGADDPLIAESQLLDERTRDLELLFRQLLADQRLDRFAELLGNSEALQADIERFAAQLDVRLGLDRPVTSDDELLAFTQQQISEVLEHASTYVDTSNSGLVAVEVEMDDAMMTALVQRFELINERGNLADEWRQIKYAGDDLKSVLNLRASQSIRTPNNQNRPFDFSFDDSTTQVSVDFDAPFNRRAQRNAYRSTLINYQASLRRLAQLEDTIKLDVRQDLRSLALDREQYVNDIASAALAYERVVSTDLELRLGIGNVAARDFLEAQNAYIGSLSNVASRHIDYIVGRLQLFLDLEELTLDDDDFWQQLYDERYQPVAAYQLPGFALPAYGHLHPCLKYSDCIRRMLCVPTGTSMIHESDQADGEIIDTVIDTVIDEDSILNQGDLPAPEVPILETASVD